MPVLKEKVTKEKNPLNSLRELISAQKNRNNKREQVIPLKKVKEKKNKQQAGKGISKAVQDLKKKIEIVKKT